jgi:hypothetical protein
MVLIFQVEVHDITSQKTLTLVSCGLNAEMRTEAIGYIRGCIEKFPDWPPGARTANGTVLSCVAIL